MQKSLPKVQWGEEEAENNWHFKYLVSIYETRGVDITDVRKWIAMERTRFGQLRHLWYDKKLHYNLWLRLYKESVCSIQIYSQLTYGSETWCLSAEVVCAINGANASMLSVISGKTQQQEASPKWWSFDTSAQTTVVRAHTKNGWDEKAKASGVWNV